MASTTTSTRAHDRPRMDSKSISPSNAEEANTGERHTTYFMKIEVGSKVHTISKRYTEFLMLHQRVREEYYPEIERFEFPTKVWLTRFSDKTIIYRRQKFEEYLQLLFRLATKHRKIKALLDQFLGSHTPSGKHKESRQSTVSNLKRKNETTRNSMPSRPPESIDIPTLDPTTNRNTLTNLPISSPVVHNEVPILDTKTSSSKSKENTKKEYEEKNNRNQKLDKKEIEREGQSQIKSERKEKFQMIPEIYFTKLITTLCMNICLVIIFSMVAVSLPQYSKIASIILILQSVIFGFSSYNLMKNAQGNSF